jgi:hypothetical protein
VDVRRGRRVVWGRSLEAIVGVVVVVGAAEVGGSVV